VSSIADLTDPVHLEQLATPSDYRLGQQIADAGGVTIEEFGPLRVTAHATGGQRRFVELASWPDSLAYTCTCSSKLERPCKHVVAVGLVTWQRAPQRRHN
jgi:uncharacterized Zn finger protein